MHSSAELISEKFFVTANGETLSSFAGLCPGFNAQDRLGIVIREPMDAVWTSGFIMSAVTAFYDIQRQSGDDYFIYPDYFIFGIDCVPGNYSMLDVWPEHKRITVLPNAEECVRAINDRGVNILLVPDGPTREPALERQTRSSALNRIKLAFLYRPAARVDQFDVQITCPPVVEGYVDAVIQGTLGLTAADQASLRQQRQSATPAVEYYRRITPAAALTYLA